MIRDKINSPLNLSLLFMLSFLPSPIKGSISLLLYTVNTLLWVLPILLFSLLKVMLPFNGWRKICSYLLDMMASNWISVNSLIQGLTHSTKLTVIGDTDLSRKNWYLVVANHQSWVDILVIQRVMNGKIPFLKFFLKSELIWVPILGIAWWALDFPFMKRFSQSYLKKNPHMKGKDIEATRKACEKFKYKPVSVMNFVEGTRFTPVKHDKQGSPYDNLLRPRAGGIAFALHAMGNYLTHIVNVSIYYPEGRPTFWQFICGEVQEVIVQIDVEAVSEKHVGDYFHDKSFKRDFQVWLNDMWLTKDKTLSELEKQYKR